MHIRELAVAHAWVITPRQFPDERGLFLETFRSDALASVVGHPLAVAQANCSVSRAGVLRGIHAARVPPGQAKYVTCLRGAVLDVVVDIRIGSPTFGRHELVRLDDVERRAVYLSEGLGHGFLALTDDATLSYLCSTPYTPGAEFGIHPLDPALGIDWPTDAQVRLSEKDTAAPTLDDAKGAGLLPHYSECVSFYDELKAAQLTGGQAM
jgi:dTDP-4-dehydrorhamnose 3,5-epimerase